MYFDIAREYENVRILTRQKFEVHGYFISDRGEMCENDLRVYLKSRKIRSNELILGCSLDGNPP